MSRTTVFETFGVIRADGTLEIEQKLAVPPGRVKVRVESMEAPVMPTETMVEFVRRSRRELAAAGHKFRTKEEIDTELAEMRAEWDEEKPEC